MWKSIVRLGAVLGLLGGMLLGANAQDDGMTARQRRKFADEIALSHRRSVAWQQRELALRKHYAGMKNLTPAQRRVRDDAIHQAHNRWTSQRRRSIGLRQIYQRRAAAWRRRHHQS